MRLPPAITHASLCAMGDGYAVVVVDRDANVECEYCHTATAIFLVRVDRYSCVPCDSKFLKESA